MGWAPAGVYPAPACGAGVEGGETCMHGLGPRRSLPRTSMRGGDDKKGGGMRSLKEGYGGTAQPILLL